MSAPVFLAEEGGLDGDTAVLRGPEGRHAAAVRRIAPGEEVDLVDGAGTRARCTVTEVGKDTVVCAVRERRTEPEPRPRLTVLQALPKRDRGELAVEMMTEAGVDRIVPWTAERCVARWKGDRAAKSLAKWRSTAREAAKQARRARVPEVAEPVGRDGAAALLAKADLGLVLHEEAGLPLSQVALPAGALPAGGGADSADAPEGGEGIVLAVGPEGGVSEDELDVFDAAGAQRALLGPTVLRTSTAGVAALAVLQARCGRW
ncbi:16S rRNA (uracil(1498)-N(3))-methyltransferase [Nocardiopsis sp. RSe5-2]|uniref:Ribosomal RNA small subunit methyltransferase E n=1 Tax=Nocardiopsis endophytica TaxID=3018445 RepID=A0ABT4UAK8_9ACTN|nr:16S rRNA (uracil(1498)-N(3))-methyltransferase [Nocardiopsis endophytica]MDA2813425.1 16S rRNA (uracil(1498)-N(3))-methyltransferase [Nocardiopsis endophytica]